MDTRKILNDLIDPCEYSFVFLEIFFYKTQTYSESFLREKSLIVVHISKIETPLYKNLTTSIYWKRMSSS